MGCSAERTRHSQERPQEGLLLAVKIMTGAFDAENGNLIELF